MQINSQTKETISGASERLLRTNNFTGRLALRAAKRQRGPWSARATSQAKDPRSPRATLKSTFLIGGIQGVIGTVLFLILGIPGAVLFGVLFLVLAAIPGLGPAVIWLPSTAILFGLGRYFQAVVMLVIGGGLIPLVDYLLRPRIVGKDTQLHPLLVFIGVLGGVSLFGIWGLLFGPLAMSVAVTVLDIFKRLFKGELKEI